MPQLIINADDFGQAPGICRAVAELHDAGALTSTTLMAGGVAFDQAVSIAKQRPNLGVGCHIVLLDGQPMLPAGEVASLLGPDGHNFRPTLGSFVWALAAGKVREDEIEREATAQIRRLQDAGITITHVDTHKHTHMFPSVLRPVLAAAKACGVYRVRNSFEQPWSLHASQADALRALEVRGLRTRFLSRFRRQAQQSHVFAPDGCIGVAATGRVNAPMIEAWMRAMPRGIWEIACHPGYRDSILASQRTRLQASREEELHGLLAVLPRIQALRPDIELTHFGNIAVQ